MMDQKLLDLYRSIMKELEQYDTPTVTNAVATYPADPDCLALYEPHRTAWYTDERMKCIYPEMGARCGFAVTCVYGIPGMNFSRLGFGDILAAIERGDAAAASEMTRQHILQALKDINQQTKGENEK